MFLGGLLCSLYFPINQWKIDDWHADAAEHRFKAAQQQLRAAFGTNNSRAAAAALKAGAVPELLAFSSIDKLAGVRPSSDAVALDWCLAHEQIGIVRAILGFQKKVPHRDWQLPELDHSFLFAVAAELNSSVRLQLMQLLIENGADVRAKFYGRTAMDHAVSNGDSQAVDFLRTRGLPYGPREIACINRLDELNVAIDACPSLLSERFRPLYYAKPGQGPTLLGIALERNLPEMAKYLIDKGSLGCPRVRLGDDVAPSCSWSKN